MIKISPSILSADFSKLAEEIKSLENSGSDMLHLDVMDGNFVPNISFGTPVIKSLKNISNLPFDVHLMIERPELYIQDYVNAGADIITIHPESTKHLHKTIVKIKELGVKAGIALLPTTPINILDYVIEYIDLILVMTVNPGFGGQKFLYNQLDKIAQLAKIISANKDNKDVILSVDGGINKDTAKLCVESGANTLVSGNYIFSGDYKKQISLLKY